MLALLYALATMSESETTDNDESPPVATVPTPSTNGPSPNDIAAESNNDSTRTGALPTPGGGDVASNPEVVASDPPKRPSPPVHLGGDDRDPFDDTPSFGAGSRRP